MKWVIRIVYIILIIALLPLDIAAGLYANWRDQ